MLDGDIQDDCSPKFASVADLVVFRDANARLSSAEDYPEFDSTISLVVAPDMADKAIGYLVVISRQRRDDFGLLIRSENAFGNRSVLGEGCGTLKRITRRYGGSILPTTILSGDGP